MSGLWEFPGGKVEEGEGLSAALARELEEELGISVDPSHVQPLTFAATEAKGRQLLLLLYGVTVFSGQLRSLDGQEIAWRSVDELRDLPMPPADEPFPDVISGWIGKDSAC